MRYKKIFKEKIHNKIHWIITKHLKDHDWHGFCCATCCDLIYELAIKIKKGKLND